MNFTKAKVNLAKTAALLLCSTVLFCGCAKNSDVVLKINDQEITRGQYYEDFNKLKKAQLSGNSKEAKDNSFAVLSLKDRYANDLILTTLLSQEFDKRDIKATPEEVQAKKDQVIAQVGSKEQLDNILKHNNVSEEKFNSDMEKEIKIDKLVSALGIKEVSDSEVRDYYNKNSEQFNVPERVKVSHILFDENPEIIKRKIVEADKNANLSAEEIDKKVASEIAKKKTLINEVLAKAKANPKDFAKLAKQYSDDKGSAEKGGDLGYIAAQMVVKEFADAAFSQKIGVVGSPVKTQFGTHIIIVYDKAKAGVQPFEQVKNDLKNYLNQKRKGEEFRTYIESLKDNAKIEYIDESLDPKNIEKQLNDLLKKQIEEQTKQNSAKIKDDLKDK